MSIEDVQQEVLLTAQGMHRAGVDPDAVLARLIEGGYGLRAARLLVAEMDAPVQPISASAADLAEDRAELERTAAGMRRAGVDRAAVIDRLVDGGFSLEEARALVDEVDTARDPGLSPQDTRTTAATTQLNHMTTQHPLDADVHDLEQEALRTTARDERVYLGQVLRKKQKKGRRFVAIGAPILVLTVLVVLATGKLSVSGLIIGVLLLGKGTSLTRATRVQQLY